MVGEWGDCFPAKIKFCSKLALWYNNGMKNDSLFWDIYAKLYDTLNLLEPYQRLHQEVLQSLELKGGERILDAGCGTGNFEIIFLYAY